MSTTVLDPYEARVEAEYLGLQNRIRVRASEQAERMLADSPIVMRNSPLVYSELTRLGAEGRFEKDGLVYTLVDGPVPYGMPVFGQRATVERVSA